MFFCCFFFFGGGGTTCAHPENFLSGVQFQTRVDPRKFYHFFGRGGGTHLDLRMA